MNPRLLFLPTPARTRLVLNLLGLIILVGGLASAASIWLAQDRMERQRSAGGPDSTGPLPSEDSRRYTHDVELYYGQTGILMDKWRRWWQEWTHGKPLAKVIAAASLILASGLFYATAKGTHPTRLLKPNTTQGAAGSKPGAGDESARPG
jgi:hypothetical protein